MDINEGNLLLKNYVYTMCQGDICQYEYKNHYHTLYSLFYLNKIQ